ncbi:MAG: hypothetical protein M3552_09795 [Planctomycetota bacterium]|nr:hypothetical protein [Planctomycetaceae bacterium]MDQ3330931.1 hypothetical protein [Planctomycetota bacterium]
MRRNLVKMELRSTKCQSVRFEAKGKSVILQITSLLNNGMFIFWGAVTLICVVPCLAHYWAKVKTAELEAGLKQTMIDRGMNADEIERVLRIERRKNE